MTGKRYTLLTGATGLLGQYLLADLLRARIPVAVLARAQGRQSATQRIEASLRLFEQRTGRQFPRPIVLSGDLTSPQLGLNADDHQWLLANCGRVLHSAASLSFKPAASHAANEPFRTNIQGLRTLIDVCGAAGIKDFHHVSSAYVCGLREGTIRETDGRQGQSFSNDYENSKLQGEEILAAAGFDSLTVYRPSIVIDTSSTSQIIGDRTIYLAFKVFQLLAEQGDLPPEGTWLRNLKLTGQERKNIVPADWVARSIVTILRHPQWHQRTYHLTSPQGTPLADLESGFRRAYLSRMRATERVLPIRAKRTQPTTEAFVGQFLETFAPYLRDDPRFDQSQLSQALAACHEQSCPALGVDAMALMADRQLQENRPDVPEIASEADAGAVGIASLTEFAFSGPFPADFSGCGLCLSGESGGEWQFVPSHHGHLRLRRGIDSNAPCVAYTTAAVWEGLLSGEVRPLAAYRAGQLLLEWATASRRDEQMILSGLIRAIEELRSLGPAKQRGSRVEIA